MSRGKFEKSGIDEYIFLATLDKKTCHNCGDEKRKSCAELDGKVFKISEAKVGVNKHPMHPYCRCTDMPNTGKTIKRSVRDESGKTIFVPSNMTYSQWYEKYVGGNGVEETRKTYQEQYEIKLDNHEQNDIMKKQKPIDNVLNDSDKAVIKRWVSSESYIINSKLRENKELTETEVNFVNALDSVLAKLPDHKGVLYRSIDSSGIIDIEKFWNEHQFGRTVTYKPYTSASVDVYDETMDIQFVIKSKRAKDISFINKSEKEYLFSRGSKFKIEKIENNIIYMEEK